MTNTKLDLSRLALTRPTSDEPPQNRRPRRWMIRYVLPVAVLLGFLLLLGAAAGNRLMPQRSVEVIPVIVKRAQQQQAGTALFQAAGWIEPRPNAIAIAALAPGVIDELLVVEGQSVTKGQAIAKLITVDAELNVEQAEATLALREGELAGTLAERKAAELRLNHPVHLQVQLADAKSMLAKAQTELAKLPFLIESAAANVRFAESSMQGKLAAQTAVAGRVLEQSKREFASADAILQELNQREPNLRRELDALHNKVDILNNQLALLVEEHRQLEEAVAKVSSATARRAQAALQLRQAELALQRCTVRAPMAGRILQSLALPGTRVIGMDATASQGSGAVAEMYDPARLQVRADVRLEDVPLVSRGQSVEIRTASFPQLIQGRVLQTTSTANVQKNTLEVKVELIDPPPAITPEMLVTATFLAPRLETEQSQLTATQQVYVPSQLVRSDDAGRFVWIVDERELAQIRRVSVGQTIEGGLVEAKQGLNVTHKLIASPVDGLRPGSPVHVSGEDRVLGIQD